MGAEVIQIRLPHSREENQMKHKDLLNSVHVRMQAKIYVSFSYCHR